MDPRPDPSRPPSAGEPAEGGALPVEDPSDPRVIGAGYQRHEPRAARLDRNWNELLQEIRVLQTGSQILAAFLIVLPFQARFDELDAVQTGWYLGLVALSLVIVGLLLTPVAVHRHMFWQRVKDEMVAVANRILRVVLALVGVLFSGVAIFIVDVVLNRPAAIVGGVAMGALMVVLLVVVPRRIGRGTLEDADARTRD